MEIAIAIWFGVIVGVIAGKLKKRRDQMQQQDEALNERRRREAEELVTVIMPTINSGK